MSSATEPCSQGEKIVVEVFSLIHDHTPVEELATAIARSKRWKDSVTLRVNRLDQWPSAETPYGKITDNTVVVHGKHVMSQPDYWTLQQALEDCEQAPPAVA
ncbi:MAG TPA: hypothetical protein VGK50_04270 [Coriobacteriia bacterium]